MTVLLYKLSSSLGKILRWMEHQVSLKIASDVLVFMKELRYRYRLEAPQGRITYGFIRFSHPTVDLAHFFYSCLDPG